MTNDSENLQEPAAPVGLRVFRAEGSELADYFLQDDQLLFAYGLGERRRRLALSGAMGRGRQSSNVAL